MKMSEEMAVRLHRMMWSDMQLELGNNPSVKERGQFKFAWIHNHFPGENIANDCWLCEYAVSVMKPGDSELYCKYCPISWPNCHCNTLDFSYAKEPISEILALPAKNEKISAEAVVGSYYKFREDLLSKASGIPASSAIDDHVKAIQEKAVEEYFEKKPAAKLATMDVDQAFKQYADEQKAPIFKQLSNASGLSENNHAVLDHIILIKNKAKQEGRDDKERQLKQILSKSSDLLWDNPVAEHIIKIRDDAFSNGRNAERDRIQEKIYEVLLS